MNYGNNQLSAYKETSIMTASGTKLVVMLYEAAIRSLTRAAADIRNRDLVSKAESVKRGMAIIQHLRGTLDTQKGGQIAKELDRLYAYAYSRVLHGSIKLNPTAIEEAIKVLSGLLPAWEQIAKQEQAQSAPPSLLANPAAMSGLRFQA